MGCSGNNATPPAPGIAPGSERIDVRAVARNWKPNADLIRIAPSFDAPFFQAGLAGYSDAAMRLIARRHGCPWCVTEALLDRTLLDGGRGFSKADLGELMDNVPGGAEDNPLSGQIMGSDPDEMAAAAVKMVEQGRRTPREYRKIRDHGLGAAPVNVECVSAAETTFAAIDVNLACPVKKIKNKARGGHWLRAPEGAVAILRAVREAVPTEILTTVKMRRGSDDSPEAERHFNEIFSSAYELGYAWVTVHGRTVEQKYVGPSKWTFLRDLTQRYPDRIVFGSGDIWNAEDIFRMLEFTGVCGASVARGCIGNPWIFRQARDLMAGESMRPPTIAEQRAVLQDHFELSVSVNGEALAGRLMRKFGIRFARHHPRQDEVKSRFVQVETTQQWLGVLEDFYTLPDLGASQDEAA